MFKCKKDNSRKVDLIKQQGPTCGIYAIAMVINKLYPDICMHDEAKQTTQSKQELAYKIFKLAIDNKISEIGELFECDRVKKLLDKINEEILIDNLLEYEIIEFTDSENMKRNMENYLKEDNYLLYPYDPWHSIRCLTPNGNKIAHWAVLYDINGNKLFGVEGEGLGSFTFIGGVYEIGYKRLFKANFSLEGVFEWKFYYKLRSLILRGLINASKRIFRLIFLRERNRILEDLKKLEKSSLIKIRKNKSIIYDMKGKMILIKGK